MNWPGAMFVLGKRHFVGSPAWSVNDQFHKSTTLVPRLWISIQSLRSRSSSTNPGPVLGLLARNSEIITSWATADKQKPDATVTRAKKRTKELCIKAKVIAAGISEL